MKQISSVTKPMRKSNIELLRILSIIGVIVLHYNNRDVGGGLKYSEGINYVILSVFESLFICAVNLFILISGFFMSKSQKRSIIKPIQLIIQVMLFSEGIYLMHCLIGEAQLSLKTVFSVLIPNNYFVILYVTLYFISPYLNICINKLDKKQSGFLILIFVSLFSVWNTCVDILEKITEREWIGLSTIGMRGSQSGYTIVNFVLMYLIGAYIRKYIDEKNNISTAKLLTCYIGVVILLTLWQQIDFSSAMSYCNPLVIIEAVIAFLIFTKIKFSSKIVNEAAKAVFTVFLFHSVFLTHIGIEKFVKQNVFILILHVLLSSVAIYALCWIVFFLYDKVISVIYSITTDKIQFLKKDIFDLSEKDD